MSTNNIDNFAMLSALIPRWMYDLLAKLKYDSGNTMTHSVVVREALTEYFKSRKLKVPENI